MEKVTKVTKLAEQKEPQTIEKVVNLRIHYLAQRTSNGEIKDIEFESPIECKVINGCVVFKFQKLNSEYYEVLNDVNADAFLISQNVMLGYWQRERKYTKEDVLGNVTSEIFRTRYVLRGTVPNEIACVLAENHPLKSSKDDDAMPF